MRFYLNRGASRSRGDWAVFAADLTIAEVVAGAEPKLQVIGTLVNLSQMALFTPIVLESFPRQSWYLAYELIMDLAGVAILLGVTLAAFRRLVLRPKTLESLYQTHAPDAYDLAVADTRLYAATRSDGLWIVDVADPSSMHLEGKVDLGKFADQMANQLQNLIQMDWGWVVLFIGAALLLAATSWAAVRMVSAHEASQTKVCC